MRIYLSICFYFIVSLHSYSHCCDCVKKKRENNSKIKKYSMSDLVVDDIDKSDDVPVDKENLHFEEDDITSTTAGARETEEILDTTPEEKELRRNEYIEQYSKGHMRKGFEDRCPYFKNGRQFDLTEMADVWEIVYYQMPHKMSCFKLFLKVTTIQEREYYEKLYGSFNERVDWQNCVIQIKAGQKINDTTKHFLQGTRKDMGLFQNIILKEEGDGWNSGMTLHPEDPDQWLLVKDLLLMRDCTEGWLIVFARVPYQPRWMDIQDALSLFGEERINGSFGCEESSNRH